MKDDAWHEYAALSAASFLRTYLEARPVALSEGTWPIAPESNSVPTPTSLALRKRLFDQLCAALDMEEFKNLCFFVGIDIDELPGDRKSARVRELILVFERRRQLSVLQDAIEEILP
jgi:hypothetical protein